MKEHQHVEWKESWRDEYLKWLSGFANAHGGTLEIGRDDDGAPVGLTNADRLLEELPNKIRDILGIVPDVDLIQEDGKDLIRIHVEPQSHPISYKGQYHYRSGSTKQELKGVALSRFLLNKVGKFWDSVPVPNVSIDDLKLEALAKFRKAAKRSGRLDSDTLAEDNNTLLDRLHLLEDDHLKQAAVILFHPDPERFTTGAYIKTGYFETNSDLRYQDEIQGPAFLQPDRTIETLKAKYLKALISYEGLQRVESYPMPIEALREAILNAVAHKDYSSGTPIQISVYSDKLMIWNPGQLPGDWTVENLLQKHSSKPYNPDIANTFFRAGMIEAWGRGIERIMDACKAASVPKPEIKFETGGLWVVFHYPDEAKEKMTVETTVETTVKTPEKILQLLKRNPELTLAQVAETIGKSRRAVERAVAKLQEEARIRYVGPKKGGHWEVLK